MTLLEFSRLAESPPPERELLAVDDDGSFRLWRSGGSVIGRFAGRVPGSTNLAPMVAAVRDVAPPVPDEIPADAAVEEVMVGDVTAVLEAGVDPRGPWGELSAACRILLDELVEQPLAAIALVLDEPVAVRLEHRGSEALPIELGAARIWLELWRDGELAASAGASRLDIGRVEAGPGWVAKVRIPDDDIRGGGFLVGRASFVAEDDGVLVPVELTSRVIER